MSTLNFLSRLHIGGIGVNFLKQAYLSPQASVPALGTTDYSFFTTLIIPIFTPLKFFMMEGVRSFYFLHLLREVLG